MSRRHSEREVLHRHFLAVRHVGRHNNICYGCGVSEMGSVDCRSWFDILLSLD